MAVEFRPLTPGHLGSLVAQPVQRMDQAWMVQPAYAAALAEGVALSAWAGLKCVACAGIVRQPERERVVAWALLSENWRGHWLTITTKVVRVLRALPDERIQMHVDSEYFDGRRWASILGFVSDGEQVNEITGRREIVYVWVK